MSNLSRHALVSAMNYLFRPIDQFAPCRTNLPSHLASIKRQPPNLDSPIPNLLRSPPPTTKMQKRTQNYLSLQHIPHQNPPEKCPKRPQTLPFTPPNPPSR